MANTDTLNATPLEALHKDLGAKMVPFAGYSMPVHYPSGILKEHVHTRTEAGLFDVSHMGQAWLRGAGVMDAIERMVPSDIKGLPPGGVQYTVLLNDEGGVIDDLMVSKTLDPADQDRLFIVVNAARKAVDFETIAARLGDSVELVPLPDMALLALQGPKAAAVLPRFVQGAGTMPFMSTRSARIAGIPVRLWRSGYTGEDGFEISCPADLAQEAAELLLAEHEVQPVGLGARDSLRLEAGLCLYGHDMDETTSPVEAGLRWIIPKHRRTPGAFPGSARILKEIEDGPSRKRVGIRPDGRALAREETDIHLPGGAKIGHVTSGGFGPTVGGPVSMGYVASEHANPGTRVEVMVRGKAFGAEIVKMPFIEHRYYRGQF